LVSTSGKIPLFFGSALSGGWPGGKSSHRIAAPATGTRNNVNPLRTTNPRNRRCALILYTTSAKCTSGKLVFYEDECRQSHSWLKTGQPEALSRENRPKKDRLFDRDSRQICLLSTGIESV
jgi:hypothetical protein